MKASDWKQVKDVFHEALRCESAERERFLDNACKGKIDLRIEVESLLISLTEAKGFLERPIISYGSGAGVKPALSDGEVISHYKIVRHIASGGMGEVYLAEDERLHRPVALKILPEHMLTDRERLKRFQREATAISALNHPNILTIFEFDVENNINLFVSEYVKGETLRNVLRQRSLSVREALDIAIQTASALQAAHSEGVIHRDIKPDNIMIRDDGYVKVLDFGLAKLTKPLPGEHAEVHNVFFSTPGVIMGTSGYVSPEQARSGPVDVRSDIFSMGVVLYEMLTGRSPFEGESNADVMAAIVQIEPDPPSRFNDTVPPELDRIVLKMIEKRRNDRHHTATELLGDLRNVESILGQSGTGYERPWHEGPLFKTLVALLILAVLIVVLILLF